jgi:hypothetical protein
MPSLINIGSLMALASLFYVHVDATVCSQFPVDLFLPLSKLPAAETFCSSKFPLVRPVCSTTVTTTATSTASFTTTVTPTTVVQTTTTGVDGTSAASLFTYVQKIPVDRLGVLLIEHR